MIVTVSACKSRFNLNRRFQFKQPTNEKVSTEFEEKLEGFFKSVMDYSPKTLRACFWQFLRSGLARSSVGLFEGRQNHHSSGPIIACTWPPVSTLQSWTAGVLVAFQGWNKMDRKYSERLTDRRITDSSLGRRLHCTVLAVAKPARSFRH